MVLGSGIRDPGSGIRKKPIPDPGVKKHPIPDPGSGSATLVTLDKLRTKCKKNISRYYSFAADFTCTFLKAIHLCETVMPFAEKNLNSQITAQG